MPTHHVLLRNSPSAALVAATLVDDPDNPLLWCVVVDRQLTQLPLEHELLTQHPASASADTPGS
jgi:hypothetical protein